MTSPRYSRDKKKMNPIIGMLGHDSEKMPEYSLKNAREVFKLVNGILICLSDYEGLKKIALQYSMGVEEFFENDCILGGNLQIRPVYYNRSVNCPDRQVSRIAGLEGRVTKLILNGYEITTSDMTLTVPEELTALEYLRCQENSLQGIDVTKHPQIRSIKCNRNELTHIDVSNNARLETLYCGLNQLTDIYLGKNIELEVLHCYYNRLGHIDVSHNKRLTHLMCNNAELRMLDASQNEELKFIGCSNNKIKVLDFSNNKKLRRLICYNNLLVELDIKQNKDLVYVKCNRNKIKKLDLQKNEKLKEIDCDSNEITKIRLPKKFNIEKFNGITGNLEEFKKRGFL